MATSNRQIPLFDSLELALIVTMSGLLPGLPAAGHEYNQPQALAKLSLTVGGCLWFGERFTHFCRESTSQTRDDRRVGAFCDLYS